MGSILVATNFSKLSENAVFYSASLAKEFNTKLILFNAFEIPLHASNTLLPATSINELRQKNIDKLKEMALQLTQQFEIEVHYECSYVHLEKEIDVLMETHKSYFLAMGMSSKSIEQNLLGNPTTTLISMKKFPVLAVPLTAKYAGIKHILFACDLMRSVPIKTLAKLRQVATRLKSNVTVFYVEAIINDLKLNPLALDNIGKELDGVTHLYKNVKSNAVIEEIKKEIKKSNAELLVMIPKTYGFWESIIHKSKTRVMASGMNIPLLSIPIS